MRGRQGVSSIGAVVLGQNDVQDIAEVTKEGP